MSSLGCVRVRRSSATATSSTAKKDLNIRGGYNVYPREVEEALHEHPAQLGLWFSYGQLRDVL